MANFAGVVSTQVLQEFQVNARKKLQLVVASARATVEVHLGFDVVTMTAALVIRAAVQAGCDTLLSEDLPAGRRFCAVRAVNPFL